MTELSSTARRRRRAGRRPGAPGRRGRRVLRALRDGGAGRARGGGGACACRLLFGRSCGFMLCVALTAPVGLESLLRRPAPLICFALLCSALLPSSSLLFSRPIGPSPTSRLHFFPFPLPRSCVCDLRSRTEARRHCGQHDTFVLPTYLSPTAWPHAERQIPHTAPLPVSCNRLSTPISPCPLSPQAELRASGLGSICQVATQCYDLARNKQQMAYFGR